MCVLYWMQETCKESSFSLNWTCADQCRACWRKPGQGQSTPWLVQSASKLVHEGDLGLSLRQLLAQLLGAGSVGGRVVAGDDRGGGAQDLGVEGGVLEFADRAVALGEWE